MKALGSDWLNPLSAAFAELSSGVPISLFGGLNCVSVSGEKLNFGNSFLPARPFTPFVPPSTGVTPLLSAGIMPLPPRGTERLYIMKSKNALQLSD